MVEACVMPGVTELAPVPGFTYHAPPCTRPYRAWSSGLPSLITTATRIISCSILSGRRPASRRARG